MTIILNIIFILIFASPAFCAEAHTLEKIVVKSDRDVSRDISFKSNYSQELISSSAIEQKSTDSLIDVFNDVSGLDLRSRSPFGIQADLSLRGSTYEEVGVLVDGINVMDPQTGHHNLDIPLTTFDVERVEVVKEGSSSIFGQGALAGSANFVTKKPTKRSLNLETLFGENALFGQGFSFSLPAQNLSSRVSFDHKIAKAARPNTDFESKTATLYLNKDLDALAFDTLFGYQKKDFGADSFYSNLFAEEEEHTETFFARSGLDAKLSLGTLKEDLFFRKHRDKFILRRNNPTSVNYHTTYVYGLNSAFSLPTEFGDILLGIDAGRDEIYSSNVGKHTRIHEAGFTGFNGPIGEKFTADLKLRLDHYQKWDYEESFNFGLGYALIDDRLKLKGSLAHAFRIPTFTELYYSDAANIGNPNLKTEKSDSFQLGLDFKEKTLDLSLEGFYRRGRDLIDWTRTSSADAWQATNLGRTDFRGIEFKAGLKPQLNFPGLHLEKIAFSYDYTDADRKTSGFFSKYALDILKHQYILDIDSSFFTLNINWQLSYQQRYYGETYFVGSIYIGKKMRYKDIVLEPFVKIDNFSDTDYSEVSGVVEPGRWIKGGLKFSW